MTPVFLASVLCALAAAPQADAAPPPAGGQPHEAVVVLVVPKTLVDKLVEEPVRQESALAKHDQKTTIRGTSLTTGTRSVEFEPDDSAASFLVRFRGEVFLQAVVERPPVVIHGHGTVSFTATKRVLFEDGKYRGQETVVDAQFCPAVDRLVTPPGLRGLVVEVVADRRIRQQLPSASESVLQEARDKIKDRFDDQVECQVITPLNRVVSLEGFAAKDYPVIRSWAVRRATTPAQLTIGAGPEAARLPVLPAATDPDSLLEFWVREPVHIPVKLARELCERADTLLDAFLPPCAPGTRRDRGQVDRLSVAGGWVRFKVKKECVPEPSVSAGPAGDSGAPRK